MASTQDETNEYYVGALDPFFKALGMKAYVTVGRWSYTSNEVDNPLLFSPGALGNLDSQEASVLTEEFNTESFRNALKEFSLTKLLAENDREIWFHFTNEDPPEEGPQVYLGIADTIKKTPIVEVAALDVTPGLVSQIIAAFEDGLKHYDSKEDDTKQSSAKQIGLGDEILKHATRISANPEPEKARYAARPLSEKTKEISETLSLAIFSLFRNRASKIRHVTFMPVTVPTAGKRVVGIVSINSAKHYKVADLEPVLQPAVEGIMAPFHLQEIDERRKTFALRSAIAAIMSRNMSHNIGSHVLWHLSQDLKSIGKGVRAIPKISQTRVAPMKKVIR